eukprot:4205821-Prymnesium_polylepis.1
MLSGAIPGNLTHWCSPSPSYRPLTPVRVSRLWPGLGAQPQPSHGLWPACQSPVPAFGRRTGGQSQSAPAL